IYLDPPYGIKFGSNWQPSTKKRDVKDGALGDTSREPEVIQAFRDTWERGVNSYLSYLRDRLIVARELLHDSGSVFVQIGDENAHRARVLMDEVYGEENFVSEITVAKTAGSSSEMIPNITDTILWYCRNRDLAKFNPVYQTKNQQSGGTEYKYLQLDNGASRPASKDELSGNTPLPSGSMLFRPSATTSQRPPGSDPFRFAGKIYTPGASQYWKTSPTGLRRAGMAGRLLARDKSISYVRFLEDFPVLEIGNLWVDVRWGFDASEKRYVVETNPKIVERCLLMTTDPGDLVLDPTCGSGTTATVAEKWGRRWITVDSSRVALTLARQRIMGAIYPYYLLADSPEGAARAESEGLPAQSEPYRHDLRAGFVCRTVPHVTLKSIANNPEIDRIHAEYRPRLMELVDRFGENDGDRIPRLDGAAIDEPEDVPPLSPDDRE
ncbi:MAG: site-specific DNA-methyltransferase, partial [Alphaproteobacteria bacterium]